MAEDTFRSLRWLVAATRLENDEGDEYQVLLRRAYNWLAVGDKVLPVDPENARGRGKARRFQERILPLLATMFEISNAIERIELNHQISTALQRRLKNDRRFERAWTQAFSGVASTPGPFLSIALPGSVNDEPVVRIGKAAEIDTGTDVMVLVVDLGYIAWNILEALSTLGAPAKPGVRPRQEEEPQKVIQPEEPPPEQELQTAAE